MQLSYSVGQIFRYTITGVVIAIVGKVIGGFIGNAIFIFFSISAGLSINELIKRMYLTYKLSKALNAKNSIQKVD